MRVASAVLCCCLPAALSLHLAAPFPRPCVGVGLSRCAPLRVRIACPAATASDDRDHFPRPPHARVAKPLLQLLAVAAVYACHVAWLQDIWVRISIPAIATRCVPWLPASVETCAENVVGVAIIGASAFAGPRAAAGSSGASRPHRIRDVWRRPRPWSRAAPVSRWTLVETFATLVVAFWLSHQVSAVLDHLLVALVAAGAPLGPGQTRALCVLGTHLFWAGSALHILGTRLRPFFPPWWRPAQSAAGEVSADGEDGTAANTMVGSVTGTDERPGWLSLSWRGPWLRWVLGGYFASVVAYNALDGVCASLLPPPPEGALEPDTVVARLVDPEDGDRIALALGAVGPCVSAPIFEEILYRGFVLPALVRLGLALPSAICLHAFLFALHHMLATVVVPLTMLGLLWASIYVGSANLLVTMLIHAMWNGRIFLEAARS